ncbi:MAG TPA: phosphoadenylyl-sulfate reductase [Chloroflexia bacterium]|nr:phosphoadenylyl-sulfate reductase [Chloroflexia bacterium]
MTVRIGSEVVLEGELSAEELEQLNFELMRLNPQKILEWAIEQFGSEIGLACSFGGISGMALLDMAVKINPDVRVFYLDTAFLFPETYALKEEVSRRYNIKPLAYHPKLTPEEQARQYGEALWQRDPDQCCAIRKVEPNRRALSGLKAWITGLRRDQSATRRQVRPLEWDAKFNLYKVSPLWNWSELEVWQYIHDHDVPYNPLHSQGYPSLGCTHCTRAVSEGEDSRAGRWSNFAKTECGLHR